MVLNKTVHLPKLSMQKVLAQQSSGSFTIKGQRVETPVGMCIFV